MIFLNKLDGVFSKPVFEILNFLNLNKICLVKKKLIYKLVFTFVYD